MSNSFKIQSTPLSPEDVQKMGLRLSYEKKKDIQFVEPDGLTAETVLNISKQGRQRLQNQPRPEGELKKAGATNAREAFEDAGIEQRDHIRGLDNKRYWPRKTLVLEWMRTDEPETYAKMQDLIHKSAESGGHGPWWREDGWGTEEGQKYWDEAWDIHQEWYRRRCFDDDGWVRNPVSGQRTVLSALEAQHSDAAHDTTVNVYDGKSADKVSYLWEISTKFNVLLPAKMLNELEALNSMEKLTDKEKEDLNGKLQKINSAIGKMKEAEKNYEGTHMALRFGVMMDERGKVTYHAKYTGCENKNGIMANSAEELLEKLRAS